MVTKNFQTLSKLLVLLLSIFLISGYIVHRYELFRLYQIMAHTTDEIQNKLNQHAHSVIQQIRKFYQNQISYTDESVPSDIQPYISFFKNHSEVESVIFFSSSTKDSSVLVNPWSDASVSLMTKTNCDQGMSQSSQIIDGLMIVSTAKKICIYNNKKNILFIINPITIQRQIPKWIMPGYFNFQWINKTTAFSSPLNIQGSFNYLGVSYSYHLSPNQAYMDAQSHQALLIALLLTCCLWIIILIDKRHKSLYYERIVANQLNNLGDLRKLAFYDYLTNLPNRKYFLLRLRAALYRANHHHTFFSLCFIDCDRFKTINDQYGHHVGDQLLQHIATTIQNTIRQYDFLARLSGDEFCLILNDCVNEPFLEHILNKILLAVRTPVQIEHHTINTSISIGAVIYQGERTTPEKLLIQADQAMYQAKQRHRGSYWIIQSNTPPSVTTSSDSIVLQEKL